MIFNSLLLSVRSLEIFLSHRRWGKWQLSIRIIRAEWKTMGILGKIIRLVWWEGRLLGMGRNRVRKKSEIDDLKLEAKGTKQPRRGSKQSVKEIEVEEQLTLARSLISNLERKNGELESSLTIMKRQVNFPDPRGASIPQMGSCESQSRHDTSEYQTQIHPAVQQNDRQGRHIQYVPQSDLDQHNNLVHSMNLIRERLNGIEMKCFRNRLHNVELGVQQQRMIHMQNQPFLDPMLMSEAPHNPYIYIRILVASQDQISFRHMLDLYIIIFHCNQHSVLWGTVSQFRKFRIADLMFSLQTITPHTWVPPFTLGKMALWGCNHKPIYRPDRGLPL